MKRKNILFHPIPTNLFLSITVKLLVTYIPCDGSVVITLISEFGDGSSNPSGGIYFKLNWTNYQSP